MKPGLVDCVGGAKGNSASFAGGACSGLISAFLVTSRRGSEGVGELPARPGFSECVIQNRGFPTAESGSLVTCF
jgi:hypothetical protein